MPQRNSQPQASDRPAADPRDLSGIQQLIRRVRRLLRSTWVATGVAVCLGLFLAAVCLAALTDMAAPLWPAFRLIALLAIVIPTGWVFITGVLRPLFRRLTEVIVARRIEREIPAIHNRLVSCVDLSRNGQTHSKAFYTRLVDEAYARIADFRVRSVLDLLSLRRATVFALISAVVLFAAMALFSDRMPTAMARIFKPFADIPPASGVLYDVLVDDQQAPGDYETLRGADVNFQVVMKKGEVDPPGGRDPLRLDVLTVDDEGKAKRLVYEFAELEDGQTDFTLTGMQRSFEYRVRGGGTWSKKYRVTMLDRPKVVGLQTALHYPEYMKIDEPKRGAPQTADVIGPIDSTVEIHLDVEGDPHEGEIELLQAQVTEKDGVETREFVVTEAALLSPVGDHDSSSPATKWKGSFTLREDGFYRVVLRNKLGHPNRQMQEAKLTAIPDNPPQVIVDRPGEDLVVSSPVKVPVFITAYDDFGLEDVVISVRKGEDGAFAGRPVERFEQPVRSVSTSVSLDLAKEDMKTGETLYYRVVARDRRGGTATTKDYAIRMADDKQAADRQLAEHIEETETLQEKLEELVAEQEKVQQAVEQLAKENEPLLEKIEQAKDEARAAEQPQDDQEKPEDAKANEDAEKSQERAPLKLDEQSEKDLAELKKELADVQKQQAKNSSLADKVQKDLGQLAEQSQDLKMLPPEIAGELQNAQQAFEEAASQPMKSLDDLIKQSSKEKQPVDPKVPQIEQRANQLQNDLEDFKKRMDAVAEAQKNSQQDVQQALEQMHDEMFQQDVQSKSRDLAELRDFIEALRGELQDLKGDQQGLMEDAEKDLSERLLNKLTEEQDILDEQSDEKLAEAREVQGSEELRQLRGEQPPAPKQQPTANAQGEPNDQGDPAGEEAPAPQFPPALGGPAPKPDPQLAKKMAQAKADPQNGDQPPQPQQQLQAEQLDRLQELDLAEKSLAADQQTLEEFLANMQSNQPASEPAAPMTAEQMQSLSEMIQSQAMQEAEAMHGRMQEMLGQTQEQSQNSQQPTEAQLNQSTQPGDVVGAVDEILLELGELDLNSRAVIMKMQPHVREDLLQGLKDEGPEGYRKFIRDYFRRLTKVQGAQ